MILKKTIDRRYRFCIMKERQNEEERGILGCVTYLVVQLVAQWSTSRIDFDNVYVQRTASIIPRHTKQGFIENRWKFSEFLTKADCNLLYLNETKNIQVYDCNKHISVKTCFSIINQQQRSIQNFRFRFIDNFFRNKNRVN